MKSIAKSISYRIIIGFVLIISVILRNLLEHYWQREEVPDFSDPNSFDLTFLPYIVSFLAPVLIGSAVIDFIRNETEWSSAIKLIASIAVFVMLFVVFLFAIFILEYT